MTEDTAQRGLAIEAMHEAFGKLFFHLEPGAPSEMKVFSVDLGEDVDPNITLQAARFDANWEIAGGVVTRMVAKICLPDLQPGE